MYAVVVADEMSLLCVSNKTREPASCSSSGARGDTSVTPLVLIFFSQLVLGIGTTLFHSLGQTYLDDHTKKTNAPFIMAMVMSLRMLGPAAGFAFSSFCLSLYIDPRLTPVITSQDPRWIGAWWLGWLVLGSMMLVLAFLMAWFPKQLPSKSTKAAAVAQQEMPDKNGGLLSPEVEPLTRDVSPEKDYDLASRRLSLLDEGFLESLKRLLQNKLLLYNIFAGVFYIMGESGAMTFSMKYVETQYHTSAAGASMISGTTLSHLCKGAEHIIHRCELKEVRMELLRSEGEGATRNPRENPPASGIVRHDSHMQKSRSDPAGNRTRFAYMGGSANVIAMVFGFLSSGFLIGKFKPRPKFVLGWNVLLGLVHVIGSVIYIFLGCEDKGLRGLDIATGKLNIVNECNSECGCEAIKYQPVCFPADGATFYSACHVGCHAATLGNNATAT
ncbi:hypothetical protein PR048_012328, partial [Dryococelus australis]